MVVLVLSTFSAIQKSVVQLLNQPFLNSHIINRLFKWLNYIRLFNLRICHIKGEHNVIADAPTRMHHPSSEPSHLSSLISEIKAFESTILHVNAIPSTQILLTTKDLPSMPSNNIFKLYKFPHNI